MKSIFSLFLIALIFMEQSFAHENKATAIQVSPETLQRLVKQTHAKTQKILLAQNSPQPEDEVKKKIEEEEKKNKKSQSSTSNDMGLNGIFNGVSSGGSGNNDAALIVFAVVGLVIIIAWIPYFPLLAYDAISGKKDILTHHQISFRHDRLSHEYDRDGQFSSGRYSLFLEEKDTDDFFMPGFSFELGTYSLNYEAQLNNPSHHLSGSYWLLGPSAVLGDTDSFFAKFDLMAGTSFGPDFGLLSKADISFNFNLGSRIILGLGLGGIYFDVKSGEGALSRPHDLGFFYGANLGYSF